MWKLNNLFYFIKIKLNIKKFNFSKIKATVFEKLCVLIYEGRKKYEEVDADLKEYKHQLLKDFSDEEIDLVYSMLQKISDNTKK